MSLIPYYLQYLSEICEGTRQAPEGLALSEQDDLKKALQLQAGIAEMGIPAFVRACAAQDGTEIPQSEYDSFDPAELNAAIAQLAARSPMTTLRHRKARRRKRRRSRSGPRRAIFSRSSSTASASTMTC